ncbi:hypothetical protein H7J87_26840 [Mycolicibacterium wolinskyi]|uniref:Uncharacterized protein n=1 Tax=Mycolicibacterium wolinskyi TaxID=59750 RepID=A0A1X2ES88_9MYCO|nr:hypothetical protein [Mycolicibacterium wolinskyi]MCV7288951.1 hypothetical protein [Mycolicibacterium wolinskyi]MCV7296988.1 hypothetical protein [Mycolicibacterium goodii]ORX09120.1 hypothetical protein AWC31_09175 [Mycolicibacterium wolinskyi]
MRTPKEIERLVTVAAKNSTGAPRVELFRALDGVTLFYDASEREIDGRRMLSTPLRRLDDGSSAMMVYTSRRHSDLPERFAGAEWAELLRIAHEAVRPDWLVIVNRNNDTVGIPQDQLAGIAAYLNEWKAKHIEMQAAADDLEKVISDAVHSDPGAWYEPALLRLRGRELYLHLTNGVSPNGQPSIRTSAAAGRPGWILTYTTRTRPGVRYGRIVWEQLVKIIKNNEEMPGVRVVNDNDDWILLGRDEI